MVKLPNTRWNFDMLIESVFLLLVNKFTQGQDMYLACGRAIRLR